MNIQQIIERLALVMDRANQFIDANAPHMKLPYERSKMIDFCTISLMHYEDHIFHWDQLRNIVTTLVDKRINHTPVWFIDISESTSAEVVLKSHLGGESVRMPVETFMMTTQLAVH